MNLFCILITLALVNVSPIMTGEYANSVYITNQHIKDAFDRDPAGLEAAVLNIINGDKPMETINLILAIPETANIFLIDHDEPFIANLPEHIAIADQEKVQEAISQVTRFPKPELGPNENHENDSLLQLGEDRRRITGIATKNVLIAAIDKGRPEFLNLTEICRLFGLLRSIRFPYAVIKRVDVDHSGDYCILNSRTGRFQYRRHNGIIVEVRPVGVFREVFFDVMPILNDWYPVI
ncbi:uncharacterized protein LOC126842400 isoform X2 [Adelges cooleyi]|uniref:uncharacterized protein LOC126842400 isoform X1 n=1 Tax=Adelges cooleyi TaxID=133065 RepID=UPI0021807F34|nr:uncharacterized protein LOC126842400 isoform X1 [Adelges cooleyi]XP_050435360.1 uncharacterized protein LOC126842400 isoform X2 [Adelges cooleyi]